MTVHAAGCAKSVPAASGAPRHATTVLVAAGANQPAPRRDGARRRVCEERARRLGRTTSRHATTVLVTSGANQPAPRHDRARCHNYARRQTAPRPRTAATAHRRDGAHRHDRALPRAHRHDHAAPRFGVSGHSEAFGPDSLRARR
ncbi:hypothetical protein [Actinospica sp.]|uniref:hypothetical protein n=1 Tax=Actinospica sp. TaxID=1872142 RepID=UPI002CF982F9|nr:hypothetical protein [Actinospica sp.]HWG27709.1 hypothetical protein [Actinospica sp.]